MNPVTRQTVRCAVVSSPCNTTRADHSGADERRIRARIRRGNLRLLPSWPTWIVSLLAKCLVATQAWAQPTITQVIPPSASEGMPVIIQGSGFSDFPTRNVVRFNGLAAQVLRPTAPNVLVAIVPVAATSGPISVEVAATTGLSPTPFTVVPDPGLVNSMELIADATFQPLDYSVVDSLAPSIRITMDVSIKDATSLKVYLVTTGALNALDVSTGFVFGGNPLSATAQVQVLPSVNSVIVVQDNLSFAGTMLNVAPTDLGFGAHIDPDQISLAPDPDSGLFYQLSYLEIGFVPGTGRAMMRQFLASQRLIPVGVFQDLTQFPVATSVISDSSLRSESPPQLRAIVNGMPGVEYATISKVLSVETSVGEQLPQRLRTGGPQPTYTSGAASNNVGYSEPNGGFDHDGTNIAGPPVVLVDELSLNWRHFFYQTFAAHRLTSYLLASVAPPAGGAPGVPRVAVVDTGFGNGNAGAATNGVLNDLPLARLGGVDDDLRVFKGIDASKGGIFYGPITLGPITIPLREDRVGIGQISDQLANSHGTFVALLVAGNGAIVQGLSPRATVIPYRVMTAGMLMPDANILAALRDIAGRLGPAVGRSRIDVINFSIGGGPYPNHAAAVAGSAAYVPRFRALAQNGQIFVAAAANCVVNTNLFSPQALIDTRGAVAPNYPLMLNVAATDVPAYAAARGPADQEQSWLAAAVAGAACPAAPGCAGQGTNFGDRIGVSAVGGQRLVAIDRNGVLCFTCGGTSWAAPQVAGLAAELVYLDDWLYGVPAAGANMRARRLQIVEIIKATADDLGSTSAAAPFANNDSGNGPDNNFGYGRINAWKAVLSVANGGIATQHGRTARPDGTDSQFQSLNLFDDAATSWYGFEIISSERQATVWIDGTQLADAGATAPVTTNIIAYKGVLSDTSMERGVHMQHDGSPAGADPEVVGPPARPGNVVEEDPLTGIVAVGTEVDNRGLYVIHFSIERKDLYGTTAGGAIDPTKPKTLSLRRRGVTSAGERPFFNLRLNTQRMRDGEVSGVTFDDFVFQIVPPDYGDAAITRTLLRGPGANPAARIENGARHHNSNLEWLGKLEPPGYTEANANPNLKGVTPEHNAEFEDITGDARVDIDGVTNRLVTMQGNQTLRHFHDRDGRDDGVIFFPLTYNRPSANANDRPGRVRFTIRVHNAASARYADAADRSLYMNLWIDWNTNGMWEETNNEHVLSGVRIVPRAPHPTPWVFVEGTTGSMTTRVGEAAMNDRNAQTFQSDIRVGTIGNGQIWARARLDYGENAGFNNPDPVFESLPSLRPLAAAPANPVPHGAARYGEVEDYLIGSDFGDAPNQAVGRYPTRLSSAGAVHLDIHQEWLGPPNPTRPSASRETDATNFDGPAVDEDTVNGVPEFNIDPATDASDRDRLDDGVTDVLFASIPPVSSGVMMQVTSSIGARGARLTSTETHCQKPANADPAAPWFNDVPEDDADSLPRYNKQNETNQPTNRRLFLSGWADWNRDRRWDAAEKFVDRIVNPEDFGADGQYTLGEYFLDSNRNGVRDENEDWRDCFGVDSALIEEGFNLPPGVEGDVQFRFRLAYGEDETTATIPFAENDQAPPRANNQEKGAALFGEVEDHVFEILREDSGACCDASGTVPQCTDAVPRNACTCAQCVWIVGGECATTSCEDSAPIPTVSSWGLVVLALGVLTGAKLRFGRQVAERRVAAG